MKEKNETVTQDAVSNTAVELREAAEIIVNPFQLDAAALIKEAPLTQEQFSNNLKVAVKLTSYIGGDADKVDSYINKRIELKGAIAHPCTVRQDDGILVDETRVVFKLKDGKNISFVSKAAVSFCENVLFPFFGKGDFAYPVPIMVGAQSSGDKRTYNFQVID